MLEGNCPKCGAYYQGWTLKSPWYQLCNRCGIDIDIRDSKTEIFTAHSTYNAANIKRNESKKSFLCPPINSDF